MTDRLVASSVKDSTYYIQEYSSNQPLTWIQMTLSGGYFHHAVLYKTEATERSQH